MQLDMWNAHRNVDKAFVNERCIHFEYIIIWLSHSTLYMHALRNISKCVGVTVIEL